MRPNAGVEAAFRRRILDEVDDMITSVSYWLESAYRNHPPRMAMDATPANEMRDVLAKLSRQWLHRFDELADRLAEHFAEDVADRSDKALETMLRRAGFAVKFKMSRPVRDVVQATVHENVSLIQSIPREFLRKIEGSVMRSVQTGRDLGELTESIRQHSGVARRRAGLIARDQNNKATSAVTRARQVEMGVTEAIWVHSHAGKKPRPTHVRMDGERYDVRKGMYDRDEGRYVFPGELINCRCVSRSVIPGFA